MDEKLTLCKCISGTQKQVDVMHPLASRMWAATCLLFTLSDEESYWL